MSPGSLSNIFRLGLKELKSLWADKTLLVLIFWAFSTRRSSWICRRSSIRPRRASCCSCGRLSSVGCTPAVTDSRRMRCTRS